MPQTSIFGPVLATMFLTFVVWAYMYLRRIAWITRNEISPKDLAVPGAFVLVDGPELARLRPDPEAFRSHFDRHPGDASMAGSVGGRKGFKVGAVPVVDSEGHPVGIVSATDLVPRSKADSPVSSSSSSRAAVGWRRTLPPERVARRADAPDPGGAPRSAWPDLPVRSSASSPSRYTGILRKLRA